MKVSIIIATFNRAKQLELILPTYLSQKYVKEILIIDDISTDNTKEVIMKLRKQDSRIKYLPNKHRQGACNSKNIGLKLSQSDYVFFGEDDLELQKGFIETLLNHLKNNKADIIAGRRIWPQAHETKEQAFKRADNKRNSPVDYKHLITDCETKIKDDKDVYLLDASMLLTIEVAKKILWDTKLFIDFIAWRSETDFQLSAAEKGFKLIFCPHVAAYHLPRHHVKVSKINFFKYDLWVIRNNYFFSNKHWKFLEKKLGFRNFYLFNINFVLNRIKRRYLNLFFYLISTRVLKRVPKS